MAKRRQEASKDIGMVQCVRDKDCKILVQDEDIKDRLKGYFDELFNGSQGVVTGVMFSEERGNQHGVYEEDKES